MAVDKENALLDVTGVYINRKFQEQSWFKENSNTITAAAGFLGTVVAWLASTPFAADPRVQMGILILGFLATVLGVKKTPNGISKSQLKKFNRAQSTYIDDTPLVVEEDEVEDAGDHDLDGLVEEYLRFRE